MSKAQISRIIEENAYAIYLCAFVKTKNAPARRRRVKEENKKTDNNNIEETEHGRTLRKQDAAYEQEDAHEDAHVHTHEDDHEDVHEHEHKHVREHDHVHEHDHKDVHSLEMNDETHYKYEEKGKKASGYAHWHEDDYAHEHNHGDENGHDYEHEYEHADDHAHVHELAHEHGHEHEDAHKYADELAHEHKHEHEPEHAHNHAHTHTHENTKAVINRLSKAVGHLESVKRMVEDGRDCSEVLIQLAAVQAALNNTGKIILKDHINHCIVDAVRDGDTEELEELNKAIDRFMK